MTVGFRGPAYPATFDDVARLELQVGVALPGDYKQHALSTGGGRMQANTQAVQTIFSLSDAAPDWARMSEAVETFQYRVPEWLVPVARDEYGNLFALSVRGNDLGAVWFWDHEEEADEGEPPSTDNISRVAAGWTQFLGALNPAP